MYCPQCGTEYREGYTTCWDCGIPLIHEREYRELEALRKEKDNDYRQMEMIQIHSVQGQPEADLIQSVLESCGIESFTRGLAVQSVHPFTMDGLGEILVLVREEEAEEARRVIAEFLSAHPDEL